MTDVEVRGRYVLADETPATGYVRFQPRTSWVNDSGDEVTIVGKDVQVYLDDQGAFAVELQASDDPTLDPPGWTYRVSERISGTRGRVYDIEVPTSAVGAGIDLWTVAPATPAAGDVSAFVTLTAFAAAEGRIAELEGQTEAAARLDAATHANGTVTALDTGQTVTNFGNSPISVAGGVLQHSPAASPQQAGYIQLDAGDRVRRVGMTVAWQPNSTGAIAIVVPSAPWSQGVLPVAGIHLVMFGNGIWHCSRWNNGETTYADYTTHGRYATVWDGVMRPIDLWIDPDTDTCTLFFPDGTFTQFSHAAIGADTGQWAIWELYETAGVVDVPAIIGEIWADTYAPPLAASGLTKESVADILSAKAPRTLYEGANTGAVDITAAGAIPPGCTYLEAVLIGGSGGAGSGACVNSGTAGNGGAAGGSAGVYREIIPSSALAGVTGWNVTVGRKGVGGASVSTASTGNPGTAGTQSQIVLGGMALRAFGGAGGAGGTTGATQGAATGAGGPFATGGAAGGINGAVGNSGANITATPGTPGSGSGGGVTTGGVANNGGAGGSNLLRGFTGGTAGVAGGAAPGVGTNAIAATIAAATAGSPGPGVGGGAGNAAGPAQAGAIPVGYGVGGGGGGASIAPNASGAGADGIGGYVLLRAHFS